MQLFEHSSISSFFQYIFFFENIAITELKIIQNYLYIDIYIRNAYFKIFYLI